MATIKIVLRAKKKLDDTFPLAIRITKDRKTSFIHLGYDLKESQWDATTQRVKKSHPNSNRLNNFLLKKLAEANDTSLELETNKSTVSSFSVKQKLRPTNGETFLPQSTLYLDTLEKAGKYNRLGSDKPRVKHFKEFLKSSLHQEDIAFADITVPLLQRFQLYLKSTRTITERTVVNHLVVIRSIFSQAMKANLVDRKYYPFGDGKIRIKFPDSLKIGLSSDEVKQLEELELENGSYVNHARNIWLFSFYFAGMRISDVLRLRWTDIQNDRLHYTMGKNAKGGSLKIPAKAIAIINEYKKDKRSNDDLLFPELKMFDDFNDNIMVQKKIATAIHRIDTTLQKVIAPMIELDKPLTMHIARHTFGNISGDKISIQMLQKLYRHSSITTTIGYQNNFIHKDADDALDAVVSF
ncbi:MAG: hypothetical protein RJA07_2655 [Bacteroidota bacterium]|jgi:integrase